MEFQQVVEQRRAVRHYSAAPVSRAVIEELIGMAIQAPSAMNGQPWTFAVVSGVARIDGYAQRAREHVMSASVVPPALRAMLSDTAFSMFYHAPVLVLVTATSADEQAREDCCLAAQTFMLAARNRGLGTCWIGLARAWLNLPQTKAELGIPERCQVVAPLTLGHPVEWPAPHGRREPEILWIGG